MVISKHILSKVATVAGVIAVTVLSIGNFVKTEIRSQAAARVDGGLANVSSATEVLSAYAPGPAADVFIDGKKVAVPENGTVTIPSDTGSHATVTHDTNGRLGNETTVIKNETPSNSVTVSVTTDDINKTATTNGFTNFQSSSFGGSYGSNSSYIFTTGGGEITTSH